MINIIKMINKIRIRKIYVWISQEAVFWYSRPENMKVNSNFYVKTVIYHFYNNKNDKFYKNDKKGLE